MGPRRARAIFGERGTAVTVVQGKGQLDVPRRPDRVPLIRGIRTAALERFLDYARGHEWVWITRRIDIARHWLATHPFGGPG